MRHQLIYKCLSFFVLLFSLSVSGSLKEIQNYIVALPELTVSKIIDRGFSQIGALDLRQLKHELNTVHWEVVVNVPVASSGDYQRSSAVYMIGPKRVIVNMTSLVRTFSDKHNRLDVLLLHEALGALGIVDEHYQVSSVISYLSSQDNIKSLESKISDASQILNQIERRQTEATYTTDGGVTVVGGGGDLKVASLKVRCLELYEKWFQIRYPKSSGASRVSGLHKLLNLKIERLVSHSQLKTLSSKYSWVQEDWEKTGMFIAEGVLFMDDMALDRHIDERAVLQFLDNIKNKIVSP